MNQNVVAAYLLLKVKNDPTLSEALGLIHKEGIKKISRAIGKSKVISLCAFRK